MSRGVKKTNEQSYLISCEESSEREQKTETDKQTHQLFPITTDEAAQVLLGF